jgi:hypothetical protein
MDATTISLCGMETASAQFTRAADATVRDSLPVTGPVSSAASLSTGDINADIVSQMSAVASYRANLRAWQAANNMSKITIDLIR